MQAVILNSGTGSRMGDLTKEQPKCLLPLAENKTILSEQIESLTRHSLNEIIITTGKYHDKIKNAVDMLNCGVKSTYVQNEKYATTNYIYSLYLARGYIKEDVILMHGDLVFDKGLFYNFMNDEYDNLVLVSNSEHIPPKDFKAQIWDGFVRKISTEYNQGCKFCLPMYKLSCLSAQLWLNEIEKFIERGLKTVYAEEALNAISGEIKLKPFFFDSFCMEVDNIGDYKNVKQKIDMCSGT